MVPIIHLLFAWLGSLVTVTLLLGCALLATAVALGCGLPPLYIFYEPLFHLCGSVLPLCYRDPRRGYFAASSSITMASCCYGTLSKLLLRILLSFRPSIALPCYGFFDILTHR